MAPDFKEREIFLCGPKPMMDSVRKILKGLGVLKRQVHAEDFSY